MMDKDTLDKVAQNAHLKLTDEELGAFSAEFTEVLDYFSVLDEIPVRDIKGLDPVNTRGTVREDIAESEIDSDKILKDVDTYDGYVRGPRL